MEVIELNQNANDVQGRKKWKLAMQRWADGIAILNALDSLEMRS